MSHTTSPRRRPGGIVALIGYVLFFAWLDWITHRSVLFIVIVGGGIVGVALYRFRLAAATRAAMDRGSLPWLRRGAEVWSELPERVRRLLLSLSPLLYFILRGQGTSDAALPVIVASGAAAATVIFLGHLIDPPLRRFYAVRDRILIHPLRAVLAPVLGVLIAFTVVHGSLLDLPALFGGATRSPRSPVGLSGRFFIATLLAAACAVLLLREPEEERG